MDTKIILIVGFIVILTISIILTWYITKTVIINSYMVSELDVRQLAPTRTFLNMFETMHGYGGKNNFEDPTGVWDAVLPNKDTSVNLVYSFGKITPDKVSNFTRRGPTWGLVSWDTNTVFADANMCIKYNADLPSSKYALGNFMPRLKSADTRLATAVSIADGITIDKFYQYYGFFIMHILKDKDKDNKIFEKLFGNHKEYYLIVYDDNETYMVYRKE